MMDVCKIFVRSFAPSVFVDNSIGMRRTGSNRFYGAIMSFFVFYFMRGILCPPPYSAKGSQILISRTGNPYDGKVKETPCVTYRQLPMICHVRDSRLEMVTTLNRRIKGDLRAV